VESDAHTQEENDAAILVRLASSSATVSAPAAAATPGSHDEDGDTQGLKEWDINIPVLGDLAALSVSPIVHVL
jgi:hypothetical protein